MEKLKAVALLLDKLVSRYNKYNQDGKLDLFEKVKLVIASFLAFGDLFGFTVPIVSLIGNWFLDHADSIKEEKEEIEAEVTEAAALEGLIPAGLELLGDDLGISTDLFTIRW